MIGSMQKQGGIIEIKAGNIFFKKAIEQDYETSETLTEFNMK